LYTLTRPATRNYAGLGHTSSAKELLSETATVVSKPLHLESVVRGLSPPAFSGAEFRVAETTGQVVIHQAHGLHEGVADRGADEGESAFLQIFAHGV
jgi:hypothetical protein